MSAAEKLPTPAPATPADVECLTASPEWAEHHALAVLEARVELDPDGEPTGKALNLGQRLSFATAVTWLVDRGLASAWPPPAPPRPGPTPLPGSPAAVLTLVREAKAPKTRPRLIMLGLDDVQEEDEQWLWPGRFPAGRVNLIMGRQGDGKSTFTAWLASAVSAGLPWPDVDDENEPGTVLMLLDEQIVSRDLKPKLAGIGADTSKVHLIKAVDRGDGVEHSVSLHRDIQALADAVEKHGDVKLIVIDPIGAFLDRINHYNPAEVREYLKPLQLLAEESGACVILVAHPSKNEEKSLIDRVAGSGSFTQLARMCWYLSEDPGDKSRRLLSYLKGNIDTAKRTAIAAHYDKDKRRYTWFPEPIELEAQDVDNLLQKAARDAKIKGLKPGRKRDAGEKAQKFILDALAKGRVRQAELQKQTIAAGFTKTTFVRELSYLINTDGRVRRERGEDGLWWVYVHAPAPSSDPRQPLVVTPVDPLDAWHDDGGRVAPDPV